jgi:hypothetical protein
VFRKTKKCVVEVLVGVVFFLMIGVAMIADPRSNTSGLSSEERAERLEESKRQENTARVNKYTQHIKYFKDPRTGLCFAVYSNDQHGEIKSITLVPEEKIPKDMLITGDLPSIE